MWKHDQMSMDTQSIDNLPWVRSYGDMLDAMLMCFKSSHYHMNIRRVCKQGNQSCPQTTTYTQVDEVFDVLNYLAFS